MKSPPQMMMRMTPINSLLQMPCHKKLMKQLMVKDQKKKGKGLSKKGKILLRPLEEKIRRIST